MKKILTIVIIIAAVQFNALSQDEFFKDKSIFRANPDWSGSIYIGNTLMVYGEGGVILKSTDLGETWSQSCINDSMYITTMIARGNELYGISRNQHIFKSIDYGENWIVKDYGIEKQFNGLVQINDKIYCLSENKIYEVNPDLEITEKYQFNTDTAYYELAASGDNLYYTAGNGKLGIINTKNNNQEIIDMEELGLCSGCSTLWKLIKSEDGLFFLIKSSLYEYNFNNKTVKQFKSPMKIQDAGICSFGNTLYNIYSFYDSFIFNIDSIYFYKYNTSDDLWIRIDNGEYDRYIIKLGFTSIYFIDKDKIIAVGKDKLIYMSNDGGKSWKLKSSLSIIPSRPNTVSVFNDKDAISASSYRFTKTTNGGITWLPQKNHYKYYNFSTSSLFQNASPYIVDKNTVFALSPSYHSLDTNIEISRDGLETFHFSNYSIGDVDTKYFRYNNFLSKIYVFLWANENMSPTEKKFQNNLYAMTVDLKDTLEFTWYGRRQNAIPRGAFEYNNKLYLFIEDYSDSTITKFALISNANTPEEVRPYSMVYEMIIDTLGNANSYYLESDLFLINNFLICPMRNKNTNEGSLLCINLDNKQIRILNLPNKQYITHGGFELNHTSYIRNIYFSFDFTGLKTEYILYKISDIENDPENWEIDSSRYVITSFLYHSDSLDVVYAIDRYMDTHEGSGDILYLRPKQGSRVNEIEQKSYIYISDPVPNPAESNARFRVYYPINQNINDMQIKVSNVLGQIVANEQAFEIVSANDHTVEVNWSIGNLPRGVYLINIKIGDVIGTKSIIIQ